MDVHVEISTTVNYEVAINLSPSEAEALIEALAYDVSLPEVIEALLKDKPRGYPSAEFVKRTFATFLTNVHHALHDAYKSA